jgi:hypothetical protein
MYGKMFLAMWSIFPAPSKTNILEACVLLIALEDGTSNILHMNFFGNFTRVVSAAAAPVD